MNSYLEQAKAAERAQQKTEQEARSRAESAVTDIPVDLAKKAAWTGAGKGADLLAEGHVPVPDSIAHAAAAFRTVKKVSDYATTLQYVFTVLTGAPVDRVGAGNALAVKGLAWDKVGVFDPVRAFNVGVAMLLITKIHKGALDDLDRAMQLADTVLADFSTRSGGTGFQSIGPDAQGTPADDLMASLTSAQRAVEAVLASRSAESTVAMQQAAEELARRREEERRRQIAAEGARRAHEAELQAAANAAARDAYARGLAMEEDRQRREREVEEARQQAEYFRQRANAAEQDQWIGGVLQLGLDTYMRHEGIAPGGGGGHSCDHPEWSCATR